MGIIFREIIFTVISLFILGNLLHNAICTMREFFKELLNILRDISLTNQKQQFLMEKILEEEVKMNSFMNNKLLLYINKDFYDLETWE